jgi:hypothetical protein
MDVALAKLPAPPVMPPVTTGADQLYIVPAGTISPPPLLGVTVNEALLQAFTARLAINGLGLTVTVTVNVEPLQVTPPLL